MTILKSMKNTFEKIKDCFYMETETVGKFEWVPGNFQEKFESNYSEGVDAKLLKAYVDDFDTRDETDQLSSREQSKHQKLKKDVLYIKHALEEYEQQNRPIKDIGLN